MNMKAIGRYISQLRKQRGWTQRQLARQLSVSHQAVSKWEKGAAMPDVEALIEMARLFGTTIDNILKYDDTLPEPVDMEADDNIDEPLDEEPKKEKDPKYGYGIDDTFSEQMQAMGDKIRDAVSDINPNIHKNHKKFKKSIGLLEDMAPFVSKDVLKEKFLEMLEDNTLENFKQIEGLLPFIGKSAMSEVIDKIQSKDISPEILQSIAPFVHKDDLVELIKGMEDQEWLAENVINLAPFLPRDFLDEMFMKLKF